MYFLCYVFSSTATLPTALDKPAHRSPMEAVTEGGDKDLPDQQMDAEVLTTANVPFTYDVASIIKRYTFEFFSNLSIILSVHTWPLGW